MKYKLFSIILISCLGVLVYSNSFVCSFHFDDTPSIIENPSIKNIHHLSAILGFLPRRAVLYWTLALNYHFNQLNVFGYHLFNIAIHLGSAILVWWLTLLTFSTPAMKDGFASKATGNIANLIALLVGLVFVSHPIQTQAVTYIVQRDASLATMFYLASLCLYVKFRLGNVNYYYICSLITAMLAMFTKETAITLPLMILLYDYSFLKKKDKINGGYLVPFLMTLFIIPLTMLLTESGPVRWQQLQNEPGISPIHYLLTQFRVMVTYLRLAFFPIHQNLDYDYPVFKNILELPVLTSLLFLISILYVAKRLFATYRLLSFSIFWFFLTLLPESSILPIKDVINEHRLYLPLAGYSLFLVSSVYYLIGKNSMKTMIIILLMITACYSILTYQRNKTWKDEFTLWNDTVEKSPHKARPYNNRGMAYLQQNNFNAALLDFNNAIAMDPLYANAFYNRGLVRAKQGNLTQAIIDYNKAIDINPDYAKAYNNRGNIYFKQGLFSRAIADYNKAIALVPDSPQAFNNRGNAYFKQNNFTQALSDYDKSLELDPALTDVYKNRAVLMKVTGRNN